MNNDERKLVELFKSLSNSIRFQILKTLWEEPRSVGELANVVERSDGTVSRHLQKLKQTNLLERNVENRKVIYQVKQPKFMNRVFELKKHYNNSG